MATKANTLAEPRAVVETGGYYYILPIDEALQLFRLMTTAERAERDWNSDGYKVSKSTGDHGVLRPLSIAQYASYKLTLDN